jgi:MinD-like ATPase involved in chromosome partitioning or flagellar assembly
MSGEYLTAIMIGRQGSFEFFRTQMGFSSAYKVRFLAALPHFERQSVVGLAERVTPEVIAVEAETTGFDLDAVLGLRQVINHPFVLVGLAQAGSLGAEQLGRGGFDAIYTLPGSQQTAFHMDEQIPLLYTQISGDWGRGAWDAVTPEMVRTATGAASSSSWQKKAFTFWSPKGGVGKTFLAVEVAVLLAGLGGRQVVLVDANMNGGHVGLLLNIPTRRNITTAGQAYYSASSKSQYLPVVVRENSQVVPGLENLQVITGVTNQNEATNDALNQEKGYEFSRALVEYLKKTFDFVIVDVGSAVHVGMHQGALESMDHIIVVVDSVVTSINDAHYGVKTTLKGIGIEPSPGDRISLVMNNWEDGVGVRLSDAARDVGVSALGIVPRDTTGALQRASNEGVSYIATYAKKKGNSPDVEATMSGLAAIAGSFYPPISESWALRKTGGKRKKLFGRGG